MGKKSFNDYINAIDRYLIPCLGNFDVNTIDRAKLDALDKYRIQELGHIPAKSTINNHNAALNLVFETALAGGFMHQIDVPRLENTGRMPSARPWFEQDEVQKLLNFLRQDKDFLNPHKQLTRDIRTLLRDYVQFLLNTGIRTGEEALNLRWKHIKKTDKGLAITVSGKTGLRTIVPRDEDKGVTNPLNRIKRRFRDLEKLEDIKLYRRDEFVFRLPDGSRISHEQLARNFKIALRDSALLHDVSGERRTLYSLRHTYATQQIVDNVGVHLLAKQMGTSIAMLEKHYSKLAPLMKYDELSGRARAEKRKDKKGVNNETDNLKKQVDTLQRRLEDKNKTIKAQEELIQNLNQQIEQLKAD